MDRRHSIADTANVGIPLPPLTAMPPNRDHRPRAHCGKGLPHDGATTADGYDAPAPSVGTPTPTHPA
jgi:hypothetical protein